MQAHLEQELKTLRVQVKQTRRQLRAVRRRRRESDERKERLLIDLLADVQHHVDRLRDEQREIESSLTQKRAELDQCEERLRSARAAAEESQSTSTDRPNAPAAGEQDLDERAAELEQLSEALEQRYEALTAREAEVEKKSREIEQLLQKLQEQVRPDAGRNVEAGRSRSGPAEVAPPPPPPRKDDPAPARQSQPKPEPTPVQQQPRPRETPATSAARPTAPPAPAGRKVEPGSQEVQSGASGRQKSAQPADGTRSVPATAPADATQPRADSQKGVVSAYKQRLRDALRLLNGVRGGKKRSAEEKPAKR